ncbi:MAG TPA: hypothetical protein VLI94_00605 [Solirubrobacterales bacterium]|nr:hypothetical protein [Solirubrobacterales bacterium]
MRLKLVPVALAAALAISLLGATSASAATEFGTNCTANRAEESPYTVIQLAQNGGQTVAPSSGVVTKWKIRLIPAPVFLPQQLKIFRPTASPTQFQVVGESAMSNVGGGENVFTTRIPIQAGDRLGLFGFGTPYGALFCQGPETENPGNSIGFILGNPTTGTTAAVAGVETEALVPVSATIEPDADADGFGDETQDACPQSAATQVACPPVALSTSKQIRKGSVTIVVTSSTAAPVTVKGVASLGKGKKAKLNGGTQNLVPGALSKFTLRFTKGLKNKLKELPPKQSVRLNVTVAGTSVAGAVTTKTLKLKLKGQAKD